MRKREGGREGDERMMNLLYGCVHILLCISSWYEFPSKWAWSIVK